MTDDRDSRVPSPVGSRHSDPELRDILFSLALAVHGWLVRHGYVLRDCFTKTPVPVQARPGRARGLGTSRIVAGIFALLDPAHHREGKEHV